MSYLTILSNDVLHSLLLCFRFTELIDCLLKWELIQPINGLIKSEPFWRKIWHFHMSSCALPPENAYDICKEIYFLISRYKNNTSFLEADYIHEEITRLMCSGKPRK